MRTCLASQEPDKAKKEENNRSTRSEREPVAGRVHSSGFVACPRRGGDDIEAILIGIVHESLGRKTGVKIVRTMPVIDSWNGDVKITAGAQ